MPLYANNVQFICSRLISSYSLVVGSGSVWHIQKIFIFFLLKTEILAQLIKKSKIFYILLKPEILPHFIKNQFFYIYQNRNFLYSPKTEISKIFLYLPKTETSKKTSFILYLLMRFIFPYFIMFCILKPLLFIFSEIFISFTTILSPSFLLFFG